MKRKDPFPPVFDGLPLLSDEQYGGVGLFLLRVSYLLISAMPLVLSMLDAIAGVAANALYLIGLFLLSVPLCLDVVRKFASRRAELDSLLIFFSSVFLAWSEHYLEAVVLLYFYHIADLFVCIFLRSAHRKTDSHLSRIFSHRSVRGAVSEQTQIHLESGEVLGFDARVVEGSAICSLSHLDALSGEFEVELGDVLFASTVIEEGNLTVSALRDQKANVLDAVSGKLTRCMQQPGSACRRIAGISIYLQTAYLLFVLMNVTFFDLPISAEFLAVASVVFCFGLLQRVLRAVELHLLFLLLQRGMFPERIDSVWNLSKILLTARFVDGADFEGEEAGSLRGSVFRVKGRLPHRSFLVAERASEHGVLIAGADLALMYRTRDDLEICAQRARDARLLIMLCAAFLLFCILGAVLLLVLGISAVLALAAILVGITASMTALSFSLANEKTV